jgi:Polyketide cyclase / dehydrase and lipid transport
MSSSFMTPLSPTTRHIVRAIVVDRHIEDVFAYVADPLNDPRWCAKVLAVEQLDGDGPGPGARYEVLHRPSRLRPPRRMHYSCVEWEPPVRLGWLEEDGADVIRVTYELEEVWTATRLTQRDDPHLGAPRLLHPLLRIGIGRDVAGQLQSLRDVLERA